MSQRFLIATKYELPPYPLNGIPHASLPLICQQFIRPFINAPINFPEIRISLAYSLVSQLHAIDTAVVEEYHASAYYIGFVEAIHGPYSRGLLKAHIDEKRMRTARIDYLQAQRQSVVDDFEAQFDAIVWLESKILTRQGMSVSKKEEQKYREKMIAPYLEYAGSALPDLELAYFAASRTIQRPTAEDLKREMEPYVLKFIKKVRSKRSRVNIVP